MIVVNAGRLDKYADYCYSSSGKTVLVWWFQNDDLYYIGLRPERYDVCGRFIYVFTKAGQVVKYELKERK